ncbi:MAG: hypothetical protein AUI14_03120 [Actinobacteria bacterium 13_2_20CM_2_71_6]|nr:MAG: hypothetical protein AUI14_03120 [Actinobacteria bacterium 13_2_20CM_2_71_6]
MGDRPREVFISYAHDSVEHREAVRQLWVLLRSCGVDARLDLSYQNERRDWSVWMAAQIDGADHVIVVASPAYKRRAEGGAASDDGRGVQWEAAHLRERLYADRATWLPKLVPVILPGRSVDEIPDFLQPYSASRYPVAELSRAGIEPLLRVLLGRPLDPAPPLGSEPDLPPRPMASSPPSSSSFATAASAPAPAGLRQVVSVHVSVDGGRLVTRTELAGSPLGEHTAPVPYGIEAIWPALETDPVTAQTRLAEVGQRLAEAMFDEATAAHLSRLVEHSTFGTVVDLVFTADDPAALLPFEVLRLPHGQPLVTRPTVRMTRRIAGVDRPATRPLPGPLKILAAVAAPDATRTPNPPLDVEAEMQAILDAIGGVGRRTDAEVTILEVASADEIASALGADQYHILHLSAHGSPSTVELEDEDGAPVQVSAQDLVDRLRAAGRPLPLIVLSSCSGAAAGMEGLAAALVRHGADRVIAMQTTVTDGYATRLAGALYEFLALDATIAVADALAHARFALEAQRRKAARASGRLSRPEYAVATLLAAGDDPPLRDVSATPEPLQRRTLAPSGRSVRELPMGYLIGRRHELRTALAVLRNTSGAVDTFGASAGAALTGIGGIGKTALAGRIRSRLTENGWLIAVHDRRWSPPALFASTADALSGVSELAEATDLLADPQTDDTVKLAVVCALLRQVPLLLLFDDFEQNLPVGGGDFLDPGFAEVFAQLRDAAETGRLLVTCRYPLPDDDAVPLVRVDIPPLAPSEFGRMFLRLPQLRDLGIDDRQLIAATIGGHPRLIEFVDALLRHGRASLRDITAKLRTLAREEHLTLTGSRDLASAVSDAVLLGSRDIVLTELLALLTDEQREVLLQAAVSTVPLSLDDLAYARHGEAVSDPLRAQVAEDAERLVSLTLLSPAAAGDVVVHAWVADALVPYQGEALSVRHDRAFDMRYRRMRTGQWRFDDAADACRHLTANARFDDLAQFALAIAKAGLGELAITALLGPVVPALPENHRWYLIVADREISALLNTGNTAAATGRLTTVVRVSHSRADAAPEDLVHQHNLSTSYERLGDMTRAAGNSPEAERHYRASLTIRQRLVDADPTSALAQRHLSVSYEKLGDVKLTAGSTADAERHFRDSMAIFQRLADGDPSNVQAQRSLAISYNKLGDLLLGAGNTTDAERYFRDSLTISRRLADADPTDPQAQRHLSVSQERLGDLLLAVDNTIDAGRYYRDGLAIRQRLADADPTNTQAQRDLTISYNKLGDLLRDTGNTTDAERHYRGSLAIRQRLADADPGNAQAQRDLSSCYINLGDLIRAFDNTTEAERFYRNSFDIAQRLADGDPRNVLVQRDLSISYCRLGDLLRDAGNTTDAERHYRESLDIARRLADASPGNTKAQDDLSFVQARLDALAGLMREDPTDN